MEIVKRIIKYNTMSYFYCPNYEICHGIIQIGESACTSISCNMVKIVCSPIRDSDNNYTLLKLNEPLPVCWECMASYNEDEKDEKTKYLSFIDSTECCICLKTDRGVSFPNCEHYTCIPCHKRCWFGPTPIKIDFPYCDEIKKLYHSDCKNEIWEKDPKIQEYIKEDCRLEYERMDQWEQEKNLRKCPLCRK